MITHPTREMLMAGLKAMKVMPSDTEEFYPLMEAAYIAMMVAKNDGASGINDPVEYCGLVDTELPSICDEVDVDYKPDVAFSGPDDDGFAWISIVADGEETMINLGPWANVERVAAMWLQSLLRMDQAGRSKLNL